MNLVFLMVIIPIMSVIMIAIVMIVMHITPGVLVLIMNERHTGG